MRYIEAIYLGLRLQLLIMVSDLNFGQSDLFARACKSNKAILRGPVELILLQECVANNMVRLVKKG